MTPMLQLLLHLPGVLALVSIGLFLAGKLFDWAIERAHRCIELAHAWLKFCRDLDEYREGR